MDPQIQSNQLQGTPTLAEVIEQGVHKVLLTIHTQMPGQVQTWNEEDGTADILPLLMYKPPGQPAQAFPVIPHVPVMIYGSTSGWIRFPVKSGDLVELHFHERALDTWFSNGGLVDPADPRLFHLTDAVATPGLRSGAAPVVPKGDSTSAEWAFGTSWIEITQAGKFKITNGTVELFSLLDQLISALESCTSPPPSYTLDPGTLATLATLKANIDALKG